MPVGPVVRALFGPFEHRAAEAYRSVFVNLDAFAGLVCKWVPRADRILEVGCGEGAMTERLTRDYPSAKVIAIDITPRIGRLYRGPAANVTFSQEFVEEVAAREPGSFDLVILADVLHHVPRDQRQSLLNAIREAMMPRGFLVFKDWLITPTPIHWLCQSSDRYLTGDDVAYFTMDGMNSLLTATFGGDSIRGTDTIRPWKNNVALLLQRSNGISYSRNDA